MHCGIKRLLFPYIFIGRLNNTVYEKNIILYTKRILHPSCQAIYRSTSVSKKYLRAAKYLLSLSQSENK